MGRCSRCGELYAETARFCQACGSPVSAASPGPTRARKIVTVVFSDVTGSTAMGERLDAEAVRSVMAAYFDRMRAVLERHGGTVEKFDWPVTAPAVAEDTEQVDRHDPLEVLVRGLLDGHHLPEAPRRRV